MVAVIMAQCLPWIEILLALIYRFVLRAQYFRDLAKMASGYADAAGTFAGGTQLTSIRANNTAVNGGQILLNGSTGNRYDYANVGINPLAFNT